MKVLSRILQRYITVNVPFDLLASVYTNPDAWPVFLPKRPLKFGPVLCLPPDSAKISAIF